MKRSLIALGFGLFVSAFIEWSQDVQIQGLDSWFIFAIPCLNLPARLLEWPFTYTHLKLIGPVEIPKQGWLGRNNIESAEPPWLADSFPFYVTGVIGIFLSVMAIIVMIGRKIRDLAARH